MKKKVRAPLRSKREQKTPVRVTPASPADEREETFWNTPGATARTLHFTGDSLLDEEIDINDVSASSFGTPAVPPKKADKTPRQGLLARHRPSVGERVEIAPEPEDDYDEDEVESVLDDGEADETAEPTVVFQKAPLPSPPEEPQAPSPPPEPTPVAPAESPVATSSKTTPHRQKVRVTTELERIVVRTFLVVAVWQS